MNFDHYVEIVKQFVKLNKILGEITIHPDRSVDVQGSVFLSGLLLTELPLQFGKIGGAFHFQSNDNITSSKGFPREVGASMKVISNERLASLEYFPKKIGWSLHIIENESLSHNKENFEAIINCKIMAEIEMDKSLSIAFERYKTIKYIIN